MCRDGLSTEGHDCVAESIVGFVVFVARHVVMQDVPQSLDGVEVGAIGWQKVQNDAPPAGGEPFFDRCAIVVTRIVEKDVDFAFILVDGLQICEQLDGRVSINRDVVHESELACCQV